MNAVSLLISLDSAGYTVLRMLLSVLWQSTIVLAAAGALAWFLRRRGESIRHILWTGAVCLIPLLPLLTLGAARLGSPRAEIQIFQPYFAPVIQMRDTDLNLSSFAAQGQNQGRNQDLRDVNGSKKINMVENKRPHTLSFLDYPWALGLAGYLLLVFALLFWIAAGRLRIRRWILDGEAVIDPRVLDTFREAGLRLGLRCEYPVIEHKTIPAPVACRIFHPVIIIPSGFTKELTEAELRAVAFHELTHIRRRDTLIFALVSLIRAVFFFQPFMWYACRRISYLAELACDRAVLDSQGDSAAYAEFLTRIALHLPDRALSTELAAGILFSKSSFFQRIREILSDRSARVKKLSRLALAVLVCAGVLSLAVAAALPIGEVPTKEVKEGVKIQTATKSAEKGAISKPAVHDDKRSADIDSLVAGEIDIKGKALSPEGKPLKDVTVAVAIPVENFAQPNEPYVDGIMVNFRKTDETGSFSLRLPQNQKVTIWAEQEQLHLGGETEVETKPGAEVTILLHKNEITSIEGRIVNKDGLPLSGAEIRHKQKIIFINDKVGFDNSIVSRTDALGHFLIKDLMVGKTYRFTVKALGYHETEIAVPTLQKKTPPLPDIILKKGSLKSMKDEMIEKEAVVFGDEWAMIDNSKFIYISQAWGEQLRPPDGLKRAIFNLAEAVNRYTNINAKVYTHLFIDSRKIFETPFVYIASDNVFKLSELEARNFGQYLCRGGFALIDNCASSDKLNQVEAALKQMMRDSLGSDAKFSPIPDNHELYHCFFDFNNGPPGGYEDHITKPEGIWLDNRLAIIYSNNGYSYRWNEVTNNDPQLKFGVNLVVYAISQENGIGYPKSMKSKP